MKENISFDQITRCAKRDWPIQELGLSWLKPPTMPVKKF